MFEFFKKLFGNNTCENCNTTETVITEDTNIIEPTVIDTAPEEVTPEITPIVTENTEVIEPVKQAESIEPVVI